MKKEQKELAVLVERVRERTPLIHNITNCVTVNDCANILDVYKRQVLLW